MTLQERIDYLSYVFELLQSTSSRNEKELIIKDIKSEVKEDFDYVIECLAGKHKFGYKYYKTIPCFQFGELSKLSVKDILLYLQTPILQNDLSNANIGTYVQTTNQWYDFLEPIVNRTLKLGIGNSLLDKTDVSPMLAKKYEGQILNDKNGIFITEKLDGNRCIAQYVNDKWIFTSRNGKEMYVDFDMKYFDKNKIYDGEVMSEQQTLESVLRYNRQGINIEGSFNKTSGLINRHTLDKKVVYNVFDIVDKNTPYYERRAELNDMVSKHDEFKYFDIVNNVRILPVFQIGLDNITDSLDYITTTGGEGLMINLGSAYYQQKRTSDLLKLKKVQTMDLKVIDWEYGNGKYEGMLGYLVCEGEYQGNKISCKVGTGISDEQRESWALHPELILGNIIEVAYFSLSQNTNTIGTKIYSLRFPRLKKVRYEKTESSEY